MAMAKTKAKAEQKQIKSCFSHLGGTFGNRLTVRFEELGWISKDPESKHFFLTTKVKKNLTNSVSIPQTYEKSNLGSCCQP